MIHRLSGLLGGIIVVIWIAATARTPTPKRKFIDPDNMNVAVRPGDNFYAYANGNWLKNNPIPAAKTSWGSFNELRDKSTKAIVDILENAAKNTNRGRLYQAVGDFFVSGMDSSTIEKRGLDPIKADLARLDAVTHRAAAMNEIAYQRSQGHSMLFGFSVTQDRKNPAKYLPNFGQGGITLPDRDYYLKNDTRSLTIRDAYRNYLTNMLALAGEEPTRASQNADVVMRFETALASAHMSRVDMRDPYKTYTKITLAAFSKQTPDLDWRSQMAQFGVRNQDTVLVQNPLFYRSLDSLVTATPVEELKMYIRWHIIKEAAPYLTDAVVNENFVFDKVLNGQKEPTPRWQRISNQINNQLGDLIGQLYVQTNFRPDAKQRTLALVNNLEVSFREHINGLDWMSIDTKKRALSKLGAFKRKIGYPDKWKTYDGLNINRNDYYGNVQAAQKWAYTYMISRLGKPVDRTEWNMTPSTVNAQYNPVNNDISFPAAILQFPFFDAEADDAVNYGAIGAVIGHEMTHGFDDQGRQYDADGTLRDWWTKQDAANFKERADKVVAQFARFKVLDSLAVNGKLTLGENLADLGGLAIAYDAFKKTAQGRSRKKIDGLSPDQRFFLAWAQLWRSSQRPESMAQRVLTDPHAPDIYRVNGPLSNIDAWYEAFNIRPGDKLYKPKEERIRIW